MKGHRATKCKKPKQDKGKQNQGNQNQNKNNQGRSNQKCFRCGKMNHIDRNCWDNLANASKRPVSYKPTNEQANVSVGNYNTDTEFLMAMFCSPLTALFLSAIARIRAKSITRG